MTSQEEQKLYNGLRIKRPSKGVIFELIGYKIQPMTLREKMYTIKEMIIWFWRTF